MTTTDDTEGGPRNLFDDMITDVIEAHCERHGDYQANKVRIFGRDHIGGCPACEEDRALQEAKEAEERRQRLAAEQRQRTIEARLRGAAIPARFKAAEFDGYQAETEGQKKALRHCRAFAETWKDRRRDGFNLILVGSTGTGKTHLACAIANALIHEYMAVVAFGTLSDMARAVKASFAPDSGVTERQAIQALVTPDLLVLDEVGGKECTEYERELLYSVINGRYQERRPIIMTSNLPRAELEVFLGDRMADRLRDPGAYIAFDWASHRGRK